MSRRSKITSEAKGQLGSPRNLRSGNLLESAKKTDMEHSEFCEEIFEKLLEKMNVQLEKNNLEMLEKFDVKFDEISERLEAKSVENNDSVV